MPFGCIFVPDFPVAAVMRSDPEFSCSVGHGEVMHQALAVLDGSPPDVRVVAANETARSCGIEIGMSRLQAEACSTVRLRHRSHSQEKATQAALLDCAYAFSPRVEMAAADTVLLDLDGTERLFGPVQVIASELVRQTSELGLEVQIGTAGNPESAIHAARGFSGITIVSPGREGERLANLPLELLSPSPEVLETLKRWGVRSFGDLAALPSMALSERLGQEGLRLQRLARGLDQRLLICTEPPWHFQESLELGKSVDQLEPLAFILNSLLGKLCARLGARSLAAQELELKLHLDYDRTGSPAKIHQRTLRLPVPMRDSKVLLKLLQLDLSSHPPPSAVIKVDLRAEPARPRAAQAGLFLLRTIEPERLEVTLARIRAVIGDGSLGEGELARVGSPELTDSHHPDSFRMVPFAPSCEASRPGKTSERWVSRPTMAFRFYRPPLRAEVEISGGIPHRLTLWDPLLKRSQHSRVVATAGPWRSSGDWWANHCWSREEWDLALCSEKSSNDDKLRIESFALYRVYRDSATGEWFVQGVYD
jgi:protein ImuB